MTEIIALKKSAADDSIELTILISKFNRLALQINRLGNTMSREEKDELYIKLKAVEEQINKL